MSLREIAMSARLATRALSTLYRQMSLVRSCASERCSDKIDARFFDAEELCFPTAKVVYSKDACLV